MTDPVENPHADKKLETSISRGTLDHLAPEPMEVDFRAIEKTKEAAINPLTDFGPPPRRTSSPDELEIRLIDVGDNDPHTPPA